jgi:hypothetical protein
MEIGERASQLKEQGVLANRRVSWNETAEAARSVDVDKFLHERGNRALSGAEGLAVRNTYNENQAFLSRAYKDLERLSEDTPEYADLAQRVALMESRADALLQRFVRGASQQGRDFNALKILANQTTDPFVWLTKLQRVMGPGEMVTRDMRRKIVDLAEKGDRLGLANEVQKHRKPLTWRDTAYWTTLIRAGMLTLPVSVGRALFGNTGRAAYETMAQPGAVAADAIFSLITHKRAVTFGGFTGAKARLGGFVRGLKQSPAALRGDLLEETLDKFDTPINTRLAPIFGETAVADAFVRYVFGSQGAVDRPFREMAKSANLVEQARIVAYHGSLEEQAKEMARLGLPEGVSRAEFVDQMVRNPSAQMRVRAGVEALHEVFQNKTIASAAGTGIISGIRQVSPPAANIFQASVLPFVRTPSAVGTIGIESTPIGALGTVADLVRLWRGAAGDAVDEKALYELQRRASKRAGRWGTGILGVVMGYSLYASDRMTGPLPSSRSEREQWREAGKQPYSIRIGGRWHPVGQIQPLGAIVAFGSGLAHSDEAEHGPLRALFDLSAFGGATSAALRSLLDLPFISGVTDITRAIQEGADKPIGEQVGQFARRKAGSVIPNIVAGLARATDPVIREADTVWQALKARVPGASRTLPEKPGLFGETIVRERGKRNQVLYAFFNVTGSREAKAETMPVLAEIESVGFIVPALRGKQKDEPAEGYRQRKRMYGRLTELALEEAIQSETYQLLGPIAREYVRTDPRLADVPPGELADALRREMLGDAVSRARRELTAALREQQ